jgi:arylsulfatase A-like enzyme
MSARAATLVDKGVALLREGSGQEQFLFMHLMDAHWPYAPPGEFITRFGERPTDISGLVERFEERGPANPTELEQIIDLYDAEIAYLDQELGRFFAELKKMKLYDNSLIILTADHGEAFYEHGHWEHARPWQHDGPGLYEEVVRIPLIVKWPRESISLEIHDVVSQMDIFPTIQDTAGMDPLEGWAVNLRRYVDSTSPPPPDRKVIAEFTSYSDDAGAEMQIALRSLEYKYIARFRSPSEKGLFSGNVLEEELYDLSNDRHEAVNLLADSDHSDRGSDPFRDVLRAYMADVRRCRPNLQGEAVTVDEALLEELRKLGYIEK